jgi:hypothetical protein
MITATSMTGWQLAAGVGLLALAFFALLALVVLLAFAAGGQAKTSPSQKPSARLNGHRAHQASVIRDVQGRHAERGALPVIDHTGAAALTRSTTCASGVSGTDEVRTRAAQGRGNTPPSD